MKATKTTINKKVPGTVLPLGKLEDEAKKFDKMRHHHSIKNINIGIFSFLVMSFNAVVGFYQAFKELIKIFKQNFRENYQLFGHGG